MNNVLLVDDEYMILSGLERLIPWDDLNLKLVGTASNGQEAYDFVKNNEVDIIVSDITMPLMSGIEFVKKLKSEGYSLKTIFLSGYQEFEFVKEGMALGAVDYLVKPVDSKELIATLTKAIALIEEEKEQSTYKEMQMVQQFKSLILGEGNAEEYIKANNLESKSDFNVFIGTSTSEVFFDFLDKQANISYIEDPGQDKMIVGLITGMGKEELSHFYNSLADKFPKNVFIFAGTWQGSYTELNASYGVAVKLQESYYFYNLVQDGCIWLELNNHLEEIYYDNSEDLPLISKSESSKRLHDKIEDIILYIERNPIPPNHVRYITLLLLSDALTFYNLSPVESYQKQIERVKDIKNISEVREVFEELEANISEVISERSYSELTKKAIEIVNKDYQKDLLLKEIAEELFVNSMYLGQLIKKETGQTFSQYLNSYRMKKAETLLLKSTKTVNEIATDIGYSSTGYFHRNFKETYNMTPREFREKFQALG